MYIIFNIIFFSLTNLSVFLLCSLDYTSPASCQNWLINSIHKINCRRHQICLSSITGVPVSDSRAGPGPSDRTKPSRANVCLYKRSTTGSEGQQPPAQPLAPLEKTLWRQKQPLDFPKVPCGAKCQPRPEGNGERWVCVRRDLNPTAGLSMWNHISHTGKTPFIIRKYKTATSEATGHDQGTEQGPTAHTPRKHLQGMKQPPSNTDTRKATVQHSRSAQPVATHQSQLGGVQNTNRALVWVSPGVPRPNYGFKPVHWGAGAKAGGLCTP